MTQHACEDCRFFSPIHNGSIGTCDISWNWSNTTHAENECDSWEDEDGNTILGEDW